MTTSRSASRHATRPSLGDLSRRLTGRLRRPLVIRRYLHRRRDPVLHLGCGDQLLPGWLNTDLTPRSRGVAYLDARHRFPFRDGTFAAIYSEHLIEHLTFEQGDRMLRECLRTLRPGGSLRIATPDLGFLVALYTARDDALHRRYVEWATSRFGLATIGDDGVVAVVNNFFHAWGHRYIHDPDALATLLRRVGFAEVERFVPGESRLPALRGLESHGRVIPEEFNTLETFVLEARRREA